MLLPHLGDVVLVFTLDVAFSVVAAIVFFVAVVVVNATL